MTAHHAQLHKAGAALGVTEVDRREATSPFCKANPCWIEDVEVNRLALHIWDALDRGWKREMHMCTASKQTSLSWRSSSLSKEEHDERAASHHDAGR